MSNLKKKFPGVPTHPTTRRPPSTPVSVTKFTESTQYKFWRKFDLAQADQLQKIVIKGCRKLHPSEPYSVDQLYGVRAWEQLKPGQKLEYGSIVASFLVPNKLVPLSASSLKPGKTNRYEIDTNSIYYNH